MAAWAEWAHDHDLTRASAVDMTVEESPDGELVVRRPGKRRHGHVVAELPAELQRALLATPDTVPADAAAVVALECLDELVRDLIGVHVFREQLYGHRALVHRTLPDVEPTHRDRAAEHRRLHMDGDAFVGHHGPPAPE